MGYALVFTTSSIPGVMVGSALAFEHILGIRILLYLSQVKVHFVIAGAKPELIYDSVYLRFQMGFWGNV
jgi:hypothetical protein